VGPRPLFEWLDRVGYAVDTKGLRRAFPEIGWRSFATWAGMQDWSILGAAATRDRAGATEETELGDEPSGEDRGAPFGVAGRACARAGGSSACR
jgi:hypothetical protein